jgi:hypothetical protein
MSNAVEIARKEVHAEHWVSKTHGFHEGFQLGVCFSAAG